MRQQYTCIFKNLLSSRVWALPPAGRAVWLWLQLSADPEGFVPTDMAGVALGANVPLAEARQAMEVFEAPDDDADPDDPNDGRVVCRVKGGWLIVDFVASRERAKLEAEKARKRRYQKVQRDKARRAANDTSTDITPSTVADVAPELDASLENLDQPKPTPKTKPTTPTPKKELGSPLPPAGSFEAPTIPTVLHRLPEGWAPSQELRDEARMAGVARFDEHIARLHLGPIGGIRGVFPDRIDAWIRSLFGKMRTWDEVDRAKAPSVPGAPPVAPKSSLAHRVKGAPAWVLASHAEYATRHGLRLGELAKAFAESHHISPSVLQPMDAAEAFTRYLLTHGSEAA